MTRTPLDPELERYVTEGLKRNQLTRAEKKNQLAATGVTGEDAEKILDRLYPRPEQRKEHGSKMPGDSG